MRESITDIFVAFYSLEPQTTTLSVPTQSQCEQKNLTYYVPKDKSKVHVELSPDVSINLPVGRYSSMISGCLIHIHVINTCKLSIYIKFASNLLTLCDV